MSGNSGRGLASIMISRMERNGTERNGMVRSLFSSLSRRYQMLRYLDLMGGNFLGLDGYMPSVATLGTLEIGKG